MYALTCMEVGESSGDVGGKGKSKPPGKRLRFVVYVVSEVSVLDILGDDEYATIRLWRTGQTEIEYDIWVTSLPSVARNVRTTELTCGVIRTSLIAILAQNISRHRTPLTGELL